MVNRARALIVDAEPAYRAALRDALGAHIEVIGEVPDAAEGVAFVAAQDVDLIVMSLPGGEGLGTARELLEHDPGLGMIFLNRPATADVHAHGEGPSDLHGLATILVGLGAVPRRPSQCSAAQR